MTRSRVRGSGAHPGPLARARMRVRDFLRPAAEGEGLVALAPQVALRRTLPRIAPLLRPHRWGILVLLGVVVLLPAIEAVEIWLFQRVVDDVLVPMSVQPLIGLAAAYVGLSLASGLLGWIDEYVSTWVGTRISLDVRRQMLQRVHQAPVTVVDRARTGDLLTRVTTDARSVESLLLSGVVDGVSVVARIVLFTGALLLIDWQLALLSLVVAPLLWWASRRFGRRLKQVSRERRRRAGSMASLAEQNVSSLALVQVHGRAKAEEERFDREGRAIVVAELQAARIRALYPVIVDLLELLALLSVLFLGTWTLAQGRLTLGELLVFLTYLSQLYRPVRELASLGVELVTATAGVERVLEVLDYPDGPAEPVNPVHLSRFEGRLQVQDVGYTYPDATRPALNGVSLSAEPGTLLALAGPSGAGKSTLIRLVARLADPDEGRILLDGVDVRRLPLADLRGQVAVVLQEAPMLDATIRDNVTFARPEASDAEVWSALDAAGATDFVAELPDGLDTPMRRAGAAFSGGQRQRIALARALVLDARVLVLDEPTTGLDARASRTLLTTLRRLAHERTVVVASHDPIVLEAADDIVTVSSPELGASHSGPAPTSSFSVSAPPGPTTGPEGLDLVAVRE